MFTDLAGKRQKERTNEIVDIIEGYRKIEFPELTTNQLLGYLIFRENRQGNKEVSELRKKLFEEKVFKVDAFTTEEAIAFKHNLTLSRGQMRKTRYVLQNKMFIFRCRMSSMLRGKTSAQLLQLSPTKHHMFQFVVPNTTCFNLE